MNFTVQETFNKTEPSGRIRKYCKCVCICGNQFVRREDYIKKLNQHVISCGCKNPRKNKGDKSTTWKGVGDLSSQYYSTIKNRAQRKKLDFDVSKEYLWELFQQQGQLCALSNLPINLSHSRRCEDEQTASLDRIDSSLGYIEGNVQWLHKDINLMKNTLPEGYFIELCELVYKHSL